MQRVCRARTRGLVGRLPNRANKPRAVRVMANAAFVRRGGKILLQRRPRRGLLANFWALPVADEERFRTGRRLCEVRHTITHHRITMRVLECVPRVPFRSNGRWQWVTRRQLRALALPAAHRRAIDRVLSAE